MARGKLGLPRPLLNESCMLVIEDFAAGTQELTPLFNTSRNHFVVRDTRIRETEGYATTPLVVLSQDRINGAQWGEFITDYSREVSPRDVNTVTLAAKSTLGSRIPRPLTETTVEDIMLIEVNFSAAPRTDMRAASETIEDDIDQISTFSKATEFSTIFVLNSLGLPSDKMANIIDTISGFGVPEEDIVFTCSVREI